MQDRDYGDLFTLTSSLIGTVTLAVDECKQLASLINRRFQQAFDESPVWPRYLVVSEKRKIISLLVSGSTSPSVANQYYYDSGELENGHTKYLGATDPVYKIVKNTEGTQWFLKNSGGTSFYETASSTTVVGHPWEDLTWSAVGTGNGTLVVEDKTNLIPYAETGLTSIGDFNRIHRNQAFKNLSRIEYDFFVNLDGASILDVVSSTDNAVYVTYKKQFSTLDPALSDPVVANDYYGNTAVKVPAEFFNFIAHSVYADFLRIQNKQEEALAEETRAQTYLAQELEKIDIRSNNNTVNQRFSTYVNRQAR